MSTTLLRNRQWRTGLGAYKRSDISLMQCTKKTHSHNVHSSSGFSWITRQYLLERPDIEFKSVLYTTPRTSNIAVRPLGRPLLVVSVHQNGFQPICAECPSIIYQERVSKIGPECFLVLQSWTLLKPKNGRQMQPSSWPWFHSRVEKNSKLNANEYVRRRTPLKKESSRIGAPISAIHLFSLWTPVSGWG